MIMMRRMTFMTLRLHGDGSKTHNFLYLKDLAHAFQNMF